MDYNGRISIYISPNQLEEFDETKVEVKAGGNNGNTEFYISMRADKLTPLVGLTLSREEAAALRDSLETFIDSAG